MNRFIVVGLLCLALAACGGGAGTGDPPPAADVTPPSQVTGLSASAVGPREVSLAWQAATDAGTGVQGYEVRRDGAVIASAVTATTYRDTAVAPSTRYSYTVVAFDGATPRNNGAASLAAEVSTPANPPPVANVGLDARPSNTTCVAPTRPTLSASASWVRAFPNLPAFNQPVAMVRRPGDATRWYIVEKPGFIRWFGNTANVAASTRALDISAKVDDAGEQGLLGLAFHPQFATNGRVYVYYNVAGQSRSRIAEFTSSDGGNTLDPASERTILEAAQPGASNHKGGNVAFGPDGFLYVGFGDGGGGDDTFGNGQRATTLLSKLIRIDVDRTTADGTGTAPYAIPTNNPNRGNALCGITGTGPNACPETWASGLRNPWRFSFDRGNGSLWLGDVQQNNHEEVDVITRGGNYGWPWRQGQQCYLGTPTQCADSTLIDSVVQINRSDAQSITGGYVYRGTGTPALQGRYVFTDYGTGLIGSVVQEGSSYRLEWLRRTQDAGIGVVAFGEAEDGELFGVSINRGLLYSVNFSTTQSANPLPTLLSGTGCVSAANPAQPAAGLIPYAPRAPFWSDGASKQRWMGLPNGTTVNPGTGDWDFPNGTVLVKSFALGTRLVETRLFMRHPDGVWAGYTYEWNDAQTDATLVSGGKTKAVNGQDWVFPSEGQCLQCHTSAAGHSLGLETAQLNSDLLYPSTNRTGHQVTTLNAVNVLAPTVPGTPATMPRYPDPADAASGSVTERARAYLHTNCSNCHRPGTALPVALDLRYDTTLANMGVCNVVPNRTLGIAGARIVAPGSAATSVLVARMNRRDADAMPPISSTVVDAAGVALLTQWINGLAGCQ